MGNLKRLEELLAPMKGDELFRSFCDALQRGHWRVACRRYLMLRASGACLQEPYQAVAAQLLERCGAAERQRMERDAADWALMVRDAPVRVESDGPAGIWWLQDLVHTSRPNRAARSEASTAQRAKGAGMGTGLRKDARLKSLESSAGPVRTQWRPRPACFENGQ